MRKRKIFKQEITQTVDFVSGEIIQQTTTTSAVVPKEPEFVKLYIEDIKRIFDLNQSESRILNCLLKYMSYNNVVVLLKPIKDMICRDLNMPINTLNKAIDNLYKLNILIRMHKSVYLVDPNLFGKGRWEDIHSIRLSITYDQSGRKTVKSEIQKGGKQLELFPPSDFENPKPHQ